MSAFRKNLIWLICLVGLWCIVMVLLQHWRFEAFFSFEFEDDALYHQMLSKVGEGQWIANTIHPNHRPSHFSPFFFFLWPLYALFGGGWFAVYLIKALFVGSGAVGVFLLAHSQGLDERKSLFWGVFYLLIPPVIVLTLAPFRPIVLALGPLIFLLFTYSTGRWKSFLILMGVVLAFREDLALSVAILSMIAVFQRREIHWMLVPAAVSLTWFAVAALWILPAILPASYGTVMVSTNVSGAGLLDTISQIFQPSHLLGALVLLLPLCFLPLGSWLILFAAVGVASFMLNRRPFAGNLVHLATPAVAAVVCAAVLTSARMVATRRWIFPALGACLLLAHIQPFIPASFAPPAQSAWSPFDASFYDEDELDKLRWKAVNLVPDNASVTATGHFLPALSPRSQLYEYGHPDVPYLDSDWLLLEGRDLFTGGGSYIAVNEAILQKQRALLTDFTELRYDQDGIVLLKRTKLIPIAVVQQLRSLFENPRLRQVGQYSRIEPPNSR
jgi:uncharacterized membrane protein